MFENNKSNAFVLGTLIGGAVGTLTTMLFTTQKGHQVRRKIVDKLTELEEGVKSKAEELEDSAEHHLKKLAGKHKKDD
jgi:gas vesicle protein